MIAIRGAITSENNEKSIKHNVGTLTNEIFQRNRIRVENVVALIFSVTKDLNAYNPSKAFREVTGVETISLFTTQEADIVGGLQNCIRVLVLSDIDIDKKDIVHCYLGGAENLRK